MRRRVAFHETSGVLCLLNLWSLCRDFRMQQRPSEFAPHLDLYPYLFVIKIDILIDPCFTLFKLIKDMRVWDKIRDYVDFLKHIQRLRL